MKNYYFVLIGLLSLCSVGCAPMVDDSHSLGGSVEQLPSDWTVTAVDNDNTVEINFAPLTIIDGNKVLAVQFSCAEAGINFTVKDQTTTSLSKKVYSSGDYTLYVSTVSRAGSSQPLEVPFTVTKDLLLETLSTAVLPETSTINGQEFKYAELYIEKNSYITLAGEFAGNDVVLNLDYFDRISTDQAQFLGESEVYTVYYNTVRKQVLIQPRNIVFPNVLSIIGLGVGYPSVVNPGATTDWNRNDIEKWIQMRQISDGTYQGTVYLTTNGDWKPFRSVVNWWDDAVNATFLEQTGVVSNYLNIATGDDNWNLAEGQEAGNYRITINLNAKSLIVKKVSATGEVLPDEPVVPPTEPTGPIESDNFDITTAKIAVIDNETFLTIFHTLEKDAEYTLKGGLADAGIFYNLDFFERVSANKVKFLGETGDYTLYYNPIRKVVLLSVATPDYPDYLVGIGKGFASPAETPYYVTNYPENAKGSDVLKHILYRKIANNTYQATVMLKGGSGNLEFKAYHAKGGGDITSGWGNGGEYKYENCTFTGVADVFAGAGDGNNWVAGSALNETAIYRVTVTVISDADPKTASVDVQIVTLP